MVTLHFYTEFRCKVQKLNIYILHGDIFQERSQEFVNI